MILEKQKEALVQQDGEINESIGMSLDLDSAQVLMQMLSKNLYSDAIGSTIRECASNALDSHRRAGVTKPIVVSLNSTRDGNYEFSVEDFGIGLDANDVKNIISKYGKSTKRNSNTELGMMGLGFKAPLAYSSSFHFVCRKDGIERKYMMYEGEEVNTIDLLHESVTLEENGVKVIVPITWKDKYDFVTKAKQQLAYFENVYFNIEGIKNDFSILRTEHFQYSPLANDRNMHLCLDNVYYSIDFQKLGIKPIDIPIALRFSLSDGLFPTPNREAIRYTQEAKLIILERLVQVSNYLIGKYNETVAETDNLRSIILHHYNAYKILSIIPYSSWDVNQLKEFATIPIADPTFKGVKHLDLKRISTIQDYILGEYEAKYLVNNKSCKMHQNAPIALAITRLPDRVYMYTTDRLSTLKKDYMKHLQHNLMMDGLVVKKKKNFPLKTSTGSYDCYYKLLDLENHPKSEWRTLIQEFQHIVKTIVDKFIKLDTMNIPQSFIDNRHVKVVNGVAVTKRVKLKGEITVKQAFELERYVADKNCKWVPTIYDMANFHKNKKLLVYGGQEDAKKMDSWFKATRKHNIELAIISEREQKLLKNIDLHNLMPFNKFLEGKNKPFQRIATACLISKFKDENAALFNKFEHLVKISKPFYDNIVSLIDYYKKHCIDVENASRDNILAQATEVKGFDLSISTQITKTKDFFNQYAFIGVMLDMLTHWKRNQNDIIINAIVDLLKYHKVKVDWKHYTPKEIVNVEEQL